MVTSVNRIISAKDYGGSMTGYIKKCQHDYLRSKGIAVQIVDIDKPQGAPVYARIWQSQWVADCECNTTMFVDPDDPIFFCFGCGNRLNGRRPRPVIFPPEMERREIERLLLERPVIDAAGLTDLERVGLQKNVLFVEVEEVDESALFAGTDIAHKFAPGKKMPTRKSLKPLTRSWRPGESSNELDRQQRAAIEAWQKDIKHGVRQ